MTQVPVHEAGSRLHALIEAAREGEEIIITGDANQPLARIIPMPVSQPQRRFGWAKGKISMAPDFDEPLDPAAYAGTPAGTPLKRSTKRS